MTFYSKLPLSQIHLHIICFRNQLLVWCYLLWADGEKAPEEAAVQSEATAGEKIIEDASTKFFVGTQV